MLVVNDEETCHEGGHRGDAWGLLAANVDADRATMPHEDRERFALVENDGHFAFEVDLLLAVALNIYRNALWFDKDMRVDEFKSELLV